MFSALGLCLSYEALTPKDNFYDFLNIEYKDGEDAKSLPPEVWMEVMKYLSKKDVVHLSSSCRNMRPYLIDGLNPQDRKLVVNGLMNGAYKEDKCTWQTGTLDSLRRKGITVSELYLKYSAPSSAQLAEIAQLFPNLIELEIDCSKLQRGDLKAALPAFKNLKKLHLKGCQHLGYEDFVVIQMCLQLEDMKLEGFQWQRGELASLLPSFKYLKKLHLHNCYGLGQEDLVSITACGQLESLSLKNCHLYKNFVLTTAFACKKLRSLSLVCCSGLEEDIAAMNQLCTQNEDWTKELAPLKKLELVNVTFYKQNSLYELAICFNKLQGLRLEGCRLPTLEYISDRFIRSSLSMWNLKELKLSCSDHASRSLYQILQTAQSFLKTLSLTNCDLVHPKWVQDLSLMKDLNRLDLHLCSYTGLIIKEILPYLIAIEHLSFNECMDLGDEDLLKWFELLQYRYASVMRNHDIIHVEDDYLALCASMHALGLKDVMDHPDNTSLKTIKTLKFISCPKITDEVVRGIIKLPGIEQVVIKNCPHITDVSVKELRNALPNLKIVYRPKLESIEQHKICNVC